jgi:hypothetical protein
MAASYIIRECAPGRVYIYNIEPFIAYSKGRTEKEGIQRENKKKGVEESKAHQGSMISFKSNGIGSMFQNKETDGRRH